MKRERDDDADVAVKFDGDGDIIMAGERSVKLQRLPSVKDEVIELD